jgi:hypothetical protein
MWSSSNTNNKEIKTCCAAPGPHGHSGGKKKDPYNLDLVINSQLLPFVPHSGLLALDIATPELHKKPGIY